MRGENFARHGKIMSAVMSLALILTVLPLNSLASYADEHKWIYSAKDNTIAAECDKTHLSTCTASSILSLKAGETNTAGNEAKTYVSFDTSEWTDTGLSVPNTEDVRFYLSTGRGSIVHLNEADEPKSGNEVLDMGNYVAEFSFSDAPNAVAKVPVRILGSADFNKNPDVSYFADKVNNENIVNSLPCDSTGNTSNPISDITFIFSADGTQVESIKYTGYMKGAGSGTTFWNIGIGIDEEGNNYRAMDSGDLAKAYVVYNMKSAQFKPGNCGKIDYTFNLTDEQKKALDPNKTYYANFFELQFGNALSTHGKKDFKLSAIDNFRYSVKFNFNGHGGTDFVLPIKKGDSINATAVTTNPEYSKWDDIQKAAVDNWSKVVNPEVSKYNFLGWFTDEACTQGHEADFDEEISEDTTYYAKWERIMIVPTVTLNSRVLSNGKFSYPEAAVTGTVSQVMITVDSGSFDVTGYTPLYSSMDNLSKTYNVDDASKAQDLVRKAVFTLGSGKTKQNVTISVLGGETDFSAISEDAELTLIQYNIDNVPHFYGFVQTCNQNKTEVEGCINFTDAYAQAKCLKYNGLIGYLATLTSKEEEAVLDSITTYMGWYGAGRVSQSDAALNRNTFTTDGVNMIGPDASSTDWYWVCGPEAGNKLSYTHWNTGEPNGVGTGEYLMMGHWANNLWNDVGGASRMPGYFVEWSEDTRIGTKYSAEVKGINEIHTHSWEYSATDNKLTATCVSTTGDGCTVEDAKVSLTINVSGSDYDGSVVSASFTTQDKEAWTAAGLTVPEITYEEKVGNDWSAVPSAPVNAGTYRAVAGISGDCIALKSFEIAKIKAEKPDFGEKYVLDYIKETLVADDGYEVSSTNGTEATLLANDCVIPEKTYYIRKQGDINHIPSDWVEIIVPARPEAPLGIKTVSPSKAGGNDGKITGLSNTMEYSFDKKVQTPVTESELGGLSEMVVYIRFKATASSFAGEMRAVSVKDHKPGLKHDEVKGNCVDKGTIEWYSCEDEDCDKKLDKDGNELSSIIGTIDPDNHKETTEWIRTETTHIEKYTCCQKVKTPLAGHKYGETGEARYTCEVCKYVDEELKTFYEIHIHSWEYSASDNKLIATCVSPTGDGCTVKDGKVLLTINASNSDYDGSKVTASFTTQDKEAWTAAGHTVPEITYEEKVGNDWVAVTSAPVNAGTYRAVAGISGDCIALKGFEIAKIKAEKPDFGEKYVLDYIKETLVADDGYEVSSTNGTEATLLANDCVTPGKTYYIRKLGDINHIPSDWVEIIVPARPEAPSGIKTVSPAKVGGKDGKITGLRNTMEYSFDTKVYTPVTGSELGGLPATVVYVRFKATASSFAGEMGAVSVKDRKPGLTNAEKKAAALALDEKLKVTTGKSIKVEWGKVPEAAGYDIYMAYCGKSRLTVVKTVKSSKVTYATVNKLNKKAIDQTKHIKCKVVAYKVENGKKVTICESIVAHAVGNLNKSVTDAKSIKLSKSSYKLKVGGSATIKATTVKKNKKLPILPKSHTSEFRYASADDSIVTVSKTGKITAQGKGSCYVYVYAVNGCCKKVKVTVK